jgi:Xaa-Pro aminopeptidase
VSYPDRVAAARTALEEAGADALLVTNLVNVRYLTGYAGSNGLVVLHGDGATFLTDFRYVTAAEPIRGFMDVRLAEREALRFTAEHLAELAPGAGRIGFEAANLTVAGHGLLDEGRAGAELVPTTGLVERLRMVKEEDELEAIRRSAALIAPVYESLVADGLEGRREADIAWRIRELFHEQGSEQLAFDSIVASHERGAMPHARPGGDVIGADTLVTIDIGCVLDGYASDCTRTFAVGDPPADLRELYDLCLRAQLTAMEGIRPGITGREADALARDLIVEEGHGERFGHPMGHGVGLEIHEAPRLGPVSDVTLAPGMVVTVEPGIYVPGRGGVRIEDLVIVTADGCERLTPFPKELTAA